MKNMQKDPEVIVKASGAELKNRNKLLKLFKESPIPDSEIMSNLHLYQKRQDAAALLSMAELYKMILDVHGVIMEFGVRWGGNMALYEVLRGTYEPFNYNRQIVGFDTFSGFVSTSDNDGDAEAVKPGAYSVTENYEEYLAQVLDCHEAESPISNIKKYELRKGDASVEIKKYLEENPQTVVAMAYFDFDLYEPTKNCLEAILPYLGKGSLLVFDELNFKDFPGETVALREVVGLENCRIRRTGLRPNQAYVIVE